MVELNEGNEVRGRATNTHIGHNGPYNLRAPSIANEYDSSPNDNSTALTKHNVTDVRGKMTSSDLRNERQKIEEKNKWKQIVAIHKPTRQFNDKHI